ncbi:MAG TPA: APC family permease [Solirubrobacteraceae bacterium]|nr:APC family permease [Solirubrobacteraceae bacterium]
MSTGADSNAGAVRATMTDDERLTQLGYTPQLTRVLGLFSNFSVAFTYLSPMVGIYSLFLLGVGTGGPAYIWLTLIPLVGMLFVALVFGELASHYPVAGALYNYCKFSVGPGYGWFVGWFYGIALLVTVASVDTGIVGYFTSLMQKLFHWNLNPASHGTILLVTLVLLAIQTFLNITGTKVMAQVARIGVYVELLGTIGIAIVLGINGFHHGLGFLFSNQGVTHMKTNPLALNFHGSWLSAGLVAVLAPVYIFYGFESAGDIAEETRDAGRLIPRAMRLALIWGGIASLVLTGGLLLAMPTHNAVGATVAGGGVPFILAQLPTWLQDVLLVLIMYAFFSCGTSIQGAGSRLAFSYARDGALPASRWIAKVSHRHRIPVNALLGGAGVTILFILLVFVSPKHSTNILWFTYPANTSALVSLVSFGVSGIYLSFLMTVIASIIARSRGWIPEGVFTLGRWGWAVCIIAAAYLGLMFINVVIPSGLTSGRAYFNIDWITLMVMVVIALVGGIYYVIGRPDRALRSHLRDELAASQVERDAETT